MHPAHVLVIALDGQEAEAGRIATAVADAWPAPPAPELTVLSAPDLEAPAIDRASAAILVAGPETAPREALPVLAGLEEHSRPALVLVDPRQAAAAPNAMSYGGAIVLPCSTPIGETCAMLRALLHRQREVMRLRREAELAQRFQGGLRGQITKMHEELQLAAMVQRELLPRELPRLPGVEFDVLWRPAHYVSGDIYDITALDEHHVAVFVADAVGHGVPAALMTMVICRAMRTMEQRREGPTLLAPAEVLTRLNAELVSRRSRTPRFATATYALIDTRSRVMRLAGAGHPPPILQSAGGETCNLETEGGLLGVFENEIYTEIEVPLADDDRVLFYSDGFEQAFPSEHADPHERRLPTQRYREEFQELYARTSPQEMIQSIRTRLDDQCGSLHQIDDLTLVCMHARAEAAAPRPIRATAA